MLYSHGRDTRDTAVVFIGCFVVSIVGDRSCFGLVRVRVKGPGFVHLLASFVVRDATAQRRVPSGPAGLSRGGDRQTGRQADRQADRLTWRAALGRWSTVIPR